MNEAKLKKRVTDFLSYKGIYWVRVITASKGGVPDLIASVAGLFVGIETKSDTGKQSELQKVNEEKIQLSWGVYYLVTPQNVEQFEIEINEYLESGERNRKQKKPRKRQKVRPIY